MTRHFTAFFVACVALLSIACVATACAQTESVIVEFQNNTTVGRYPGALTSGKNGTLYGTTVEGGNLGCGTLFKLIPPANQGGVGGQNILYGFTCGTDGFYPSGNLVIGKTGKIYGTTQGNNESSGIVYELTPPVKPGAPWTETVLYAFSGGADGGSPMSGVIADSGGKLYGTTQRGGKFGYGAIFRLSPPAQAGGAWKETVLYSFQQYGVSGDPTGLALENGSLYGANNATTQYDAGVIFQLSPPSGGQGNWTLSVLYQFRGNADGGQPSGSPVFDSSGALYGTALVGGTLGNGVIYKLSPPSAQGGTWTESVLYAFQGENSGDGYYPIGTPAFDDAGAIYGGTVSGGIESCGGNDTGCGIVYKLTPPVSQGGNWTEQVLHAFAADSDGNYPQSGVVVVGTTVYGTTIWGGTGDCQDIEGIIGCGTAFQITQ